MLRYEIEGGNLPVVICHPRAGQTVCTESGSMSWMSPNIEMKTRAGGFRKAMGRLFSGESMFLNEFTPVGSDGVIAFSSRFPGTIVPFELRAGESIIVQKSAFLAMEQGLDLSVYFHKKLSRGFFGGEGFIMQRISGNGVVFLEIDGHCKEYTLAAGESMLIDTGFLAAMSDTCTMEIQRVKGVKNVLFGGEGLFLTRVVGPGKVYLQSMPISNTAAVLSAYMSIGSSGVNISLGSD